MNWFLNLINHICRSIGLFLITFYRFCLSPLKRPSCRYYPTCSSYALILFKLTHPLWALFFSIIRLCKCHPFSKGGYDYPLIRVRITELEYRMIDCSYWVIPSKMMKPIFYLKKPIDFWAYILLKD